MNDKPSYTNRLSKEKSPYLLQHAHNPVDWYPWGEEAFKAAKDMDKPIFLSIGYATCHWCHVMERESFENLEVAQQLNKTFINIKVDREELPEVDALYMEFAQSMMAGAAGWPLNVILTPDLRPFFAATYLPPHSSHGLMGLVELIERIHEVWAGEERDRVEMQAEKIVEVFTESVHVKGSELPEKEQVDESAELLFKMADPVYGGMRGVPKFPIGYQSNFMLRYSSTMKDSRAIFLVERTLEMMYRGGIYDHLGGGFSRYSVDEKWLVPHFEKMLYDNALLSNAYLETWQVTKRNSFKQVTQEILNYILRDMTHPEGGFYSAEDADSEGHEGYFYTWLFDEVQGILGKNESKLFCEFFDITPEGNFEGRNILHIPTSIEEFVQRKGLELSDFQQRIDMQKQVLWKAREERVHPLKDDKILSSWNGLMIFSLARAGKAFNEERYLHAAEKAAQFIKNHLWQEGRLFRRWREKETSFVGGLDEYAFLIKGVLGLFEATGNPEWLNWSLHMTHILDEHFKVEGGAYYQTDGADSNIILRKCQFSDGAEPSGNAIQCENLLKLYQMTLDNRYLESAEDILKAVKKHLDNYPPGYSYHLMNLNRYYDKHAPTFVIALNKNNDHQHEIAHLIFSQFIPHKAVIWRNENNPGLFTVLPYVKEQIPVDGKTTLYLCHQGVCKKPITDFAEIKESLLSL